MSESFVLTPFDWLLVAGMVCALIVSVYAVLRLQRVEHMNATLFKHADGQTVERLLSECVAQVQRVSEDNKTLHQGLADAHGLLNLRIERPVFKRYNSFGDVGGNQSFTMALLDASHTGVMLSVLHSRQGASVYAKWIEQGTPKHNLSDEEQVVLREIVGR